MLSLRLPVLPVKLPSPAYTAEKLWTPAVKPLVSVKEAVRLLPSVPLPSSVLPS